MKKLLCVLLAAILLATAIPALAEISIGRSVSLEWYDLSLNRYNGVIYGRQTRESGYTLVGVDGQPVGESWDDMDTRDSYFRVLKNNGTINSYGMIDGNGKLLVPCRYGDVIYVSDRWLLAMTL